MFVMNKYQHKVTTTQLTGFDMEKKRSNRTTTQINGVYLAIFTQNTTYNKNVFGDSKLTMEWRHGAFGVRPILKEYKLFKKYINAPSVRQTRSSTSLVSTEGRPEVSDNERTFSVCLLWIATA